MTTHNIIYQPRSAGTAIYWDMAPNDRQHIISQLERLAVKILELSISTEVLDKNLQEWVFAPNGDLGRSPKNTNQQNTAASVIGGILNNIKYGTSRDLTDKICAKIQTIFDEFNTGMDRLLFPRIQLDRIHFDIKPRSTQDFNRLFQVEL